jgi:hypothetical protein
MQAFNDIASSLFDVVLAPFGHQIAAFDLIVWPFVMGILALQIYKYASNQSAISRVKTKISMHLLEIRLFREDILQVLKSTGSILVKNSLYIGHNLMPMLVMLGPMVAVMVQLVANYGYAPSQMGSVELLHLKLDPAASVSSADVSLELPKGVSLDAPAVHTADGQVFWRVKADSAGDHVFHVKVGDEVFDKTWAVGGEPRKIPVKRLRSWEALLYPGEAALPSNGPVLSLEMPMNTRPLAYLPDGEFGILMWFFVVSLAAGFALKDLFGVTL